MGDFEKDTRVESDPDRPGFYAATLSKDWEIWGPNGGYLASIALRALGVESAIAKPATFGCHFLSVARFEPVEIEVERVRMGRRSESLRARMSQNGRPVLEAMLRTAADGPGLEHDVATAPEVPAPDVLKSAEELRSEKPPFCFWDNIESRPCDPDSFANWDSPKPPSRCDWYRFRPRATFDDPFVDAGRLLLLIDTLTWPVAARPHPGAPYTAPSLDVTVWFHRADPRSDWLLVDAVSPVAEAGLMATRGSVYSRDGRLLASGGAQLMCVKTG